MGNHICENKMLDLQGMEKFFPNQGYNTTCWWRERGKSFSENNGTLSTLKTGTKKRFFWKGLGEEKRQVQNREHSFPRK